jgi:putative colanic acid biosynthesis acetyltransferase WcaF
MSQPTELDIRGNRAATKYELRVQVARVLWSLVQPFFTLSPRPFWGWRRMLLRVFGAQVGPQVHVYPSVRITMPWNLEIDDMAAVGDRTILYALGPIRIGPRATISQGAHCCAGTHDLSQPHRPLIKLPIVIGADSWVAADAFIGPGVTVGEGAVVGARSVVAKDVAPGLIVAGNPAQPLRRIGQPRSDGI